MTNTQRPARRAPGDPRLADMAAMLRVMRPLGGDADGAVEQRRLLADLVRLVGRRLAPPAGPEGRPTAPPVLPPAAAVSPSQATAGLPPRVGQTLKYLLTGDSEKQVALRLNLSPHTVHVYVKKLYRHFKVSSRAELLALHLRR